MADKTFQSTNEEITNRSQQPMQAIIEQLHIDFAHGRIGGIRAKAFPNHLQSHAIRNFKTSRYVDEFTADLYNCVKLVKQLCDLSLAIPDNNTKELPKGFWPDVVRQLKQIIQLWLRMDEVLAHLAREQSGNAAATSFDGLNFIQDDLCAASLLHFLQMLNPVPGDEYLVQISDWCEATHSLITIINEAMGREEKPKEKGKLAGVSN